MIFEYKKIGDTPKQREIEFSATSSLRSKIFKKFHFFRKRKKVNRVFQFIVLSPILIIAIAVIVYSIITLYNYSMNKSLIKNFLKPVLSELERDKDGHINILLIGQGGEGHDGPNLTDTLIVASFDIENENVVMLSVPRDLWIDTEKFGASRINEIYRNVRHRLENQFNIEPDVADVESLKILLKEIEKVVNISIPYYARIDFKGFIEIVDELNGVTVNVKKDILDTSYPDGNWGYEVFELKKGIHNLDGETALKYARSRHSTSDFDRSSRQQQIIMNLKEKALSTGILVSPRKIKSLFKSFQEHFQSNLEMSEIVTLAYLGSKISKNKMISASLNDNWKTKGGLLATPPRANYGGAFVLIPYEGYNDYSEIHLFTELLFKYRDIQSYNYEVLNGTFKSGIAFNAAQELERYGFPIASIGNTPPKNETFTKSELWVYLNDSHIKEAFPIIKEIFPIKLVDKTGVYEETDVAATFIIGTDFK